MLSMGPEMSEDPFKDTALSGEGSQDKGGETHTDKSEKEAETVGETSNISSGILCTEDHGWQEVESRCVPMA